MTSKTLLSTILCLFLFGCASTDSEVKIKSAEEIEPIHITEFTLGPGDTIDITVWRHEDLDKKIQVDPYGKIYYPFVGEITVSGMSVYKLSEVLEQGLSEYYVNPVVNINVTAIQSQKIYVLGEVTNPGIFSMDTPINVLEAVAKSGGFTQDAKEQNVLVIRGDKTAPELIKLDLDVTLKKGDLHQNIALQNGDIVYVPATTIANMSRYFKHLERILWPVVLFEQGIILGSEVGDVITGERVRGTTIIINPNPQ